MLETVDTDADDLTEEVATRCRERLVAFPVAGVNTDALAEALMPALNTPLGPLAGELSLDQLAALAHVLIDEPEQPYRVWAQG